MFLARLGRAWVDLLIDRGTKQIPIEAKSGQTIASDFFADLDHCWPWLADPTAPRAWPTAATNPTGGRVSVIVVGLGVNLVLASRGVSNEVTLGQTSVARHILRSARHAGVTH